MADANIIQILIQGGAVGISLVLIWVVYKLVSNHDEHLQSVVNKNTDAWVENAKALTKLTDKLDQ